LALRKAVVTLEFSRKCIFQLSSPAGKYFIREPYFILIDAPVMNWAKHNQVEFLLWCESTAQDRRSRHSLVEWLKRRFLHNCDGFVVPGHSALEYLKQFASPQQKIFLAATQ